MEDLEWAGGIPAVLNEIKDILRDKGLAFGMKLEAPAGAGR